AHLARASQSARHRVLRRTLVTFLPERDVYFPDPLAVPDRRGARLSALLFFRRGNRGWSCWIGPSSLPGRPEPGPGTQSALRVALPAGPHPLRSRRGVFAARLARPEETDGHRALPRADGGPLHGTLRARLAMGQDRRAGCEDRPVHPERCSSFERAGNPPHP